MGIKCGGGGGASELNDLTDVSYSNGDLIITSLDTITYANTENAALNVAAVSGTDTAGKNLTISAGQGTGTGAGGSIIFQVADGAGSTGSSVNSLATALTINDDKTVSFESTADFTGTGNSVTISDTLRIAQTGSGLRMTNVGAFDNDGSNNFRIFATNNLKLCANGDSNTGLTIDSTNQHVTIHNDLLPNTADGSSLGSATKEWSDLYLADSSIIYLGNDQDIQIQHVPDSGLKLYSIYPGLQPLTIKLQTNYTSVTTDNKIAILDFQAPNVSAGGDSQITCA